MFKIKRFIILIGAYLVPSKLSAQIARYFLHTIGIGYAVEVEDSGEIRLLHRLFKKQTPFILFDVGGNIGKYSSNVCKDFPKAQVHVFEPSRRHFELLQARLIIYHERCKTNNFGLGLKDEELTLYKDSEVTGSATLIKRNLVDCNKILEKVEVRNLHSYLTNQRIENIDFIKIDVEGWEFPIISILEFLLAESRINCIQFEITVNTIENGNNVTDFFNLFEKYGYRIFVVSPSGALNSISVQDDLARIYLSTNYVAISSCFAIKN